MYKRKNRDLMRNAGSKLYINNEQYIFPDTSFYFDQASLELTGEKCVYGIKYKDEIIYINSTSQGVSNSWQEHAKAFQRKEINNSMYQLPIEDISFVILLTSEEIQEAIGENYYCTWTLKFAEWCFLQAYKPRYNSISRNPFSFNVRPSDNLPVSYWCMMKDWLLDKNGDNRFLNMALQELNDEVIAENE